MCELLVAIISDELSISSSVLYRRFREGGCGAPSTRTFMPPAEIVAPKYTIVSALWLK